MHTIAAAGGRVGCGPRDEDDDDENENDDDAENVDDDDDDEKERDEEERDDDDDTENEDEDDDERGEEEGDDDAEVLVLSRRASGSAHAGWRRVAAATTAATHARRRTLRSLRGVAGIGGWREKKKNQRREEEKKKQSVTHSLTRERFQVFFLQFFGLREHKGEHTSRRASKSVVRGVLGARPFQGGLTRSGGSSGGCWSLATDSRGRRGRDGCGTGEPRRLLARPPLKERPVARELAVDLGLERVVAARVREQLLHAHHDHQQRRPRFPFRLFKSERAG